MGTQLILTVGTNALPVWVAWYHLKGKLEQPVQVRFVYTTDTERQREVLEKYCGTLALDCILTDSGDLGVIRNDVQSNIFDKFPKGTLHVHYTSGTKPMGVETDSAIKSGLNQVMYSLEASYLDPRGDDGPRIVDRNSNNLVDDTRKGIPVDPRNGEPDHIALIRIAELNGFELGEFEHRYYSHLTQNYVIKVCPAPGIPTDEQLQAGQFVLNQDHRRDFQRVFSNPSDSLWNRAFPSQNGRFVYPEIGGEFTLPDDANVIWRNDLLPLLNGAYPACQWDINARLTYNPPNTATEDQKRQLEQMHAFFNGRWLEYAAYDAFKTALKEICENNAARDNYKLFHSVYVRRANPMDLRVKPFELDVVAVLGHQIVVVSCTSSGNHDMIKQKGMEAYHRARQLGGDEARAIVLCSAHPNDQPFLQEELQDETGSPDLPLEVWGTNVWQNLEAEFTNYLTDGLRWE